MLLRKMRRDMKANITQFISIFLMAFLGVFVCSGLNSTWYGMQTASDDYYKETSLADLWVSSGRFGDADLQKVKSIAGISAASLRLTFDATVNTGSRPTLRMNIVNENVLSKPKTADGMEFDNSMDGIWLDNVFAKANSLKTGDTLKVEYNGIVIEKNILGLIMHPEYVYNVKDETVITPDAKAFGFSCLPVSAARNIKLLNPIPYNQILVSLDKGADSEKVQEALEKTFSDRFIMIMDHKSHSSVEFFDNEISQIKSISGIFPMVFLLIAALTLLTTMTRITVNQRTQIATLKGMGISRRKILFHYLSYGLWLGIISGLAGLFTGPLAIPPILFDMQKAMYIMPEWPIPIAPISIAAMAAAILCCGASGYFACRRQLKEVPASGLRPPMPKAIRHTNMEKSRLWHLMSFSTRWNLRDIMRSKIRTIMAIIGVMGSTALLVFGLGLLETTSDLSRWQYEEINVFESKINLDENTSLKARDGIYAHYKGQWIQESGIELEKGSVRKNGLLTVLDEGSQMILKNTGGQKMSLPKSGMALSYKIAQSLDAKKGDKILWRIYGEKSWRESEIKDIFRMPTGQGMAMSREAFEAMGKKMVPTSLLSPDKAADARELVGIKSIQDKEQLKESFNQLLESMYAIMAILIAASIILGSVVLYNLGVLSFSERTREFATLKVLGFFPKIIRGLIGRQNIWTTVLGILLGIPAGYALVEYMMATMSDSLDMRTYISLPSWIMCILGVFTLSFTVNLILSRKIKDINMVGSLKSVE